MKTSNIEQIQKSFSVQAENFDTKAMNFSKKEYLDYTVSCIAPTKEDRVLEVAAGTCACGISLAPLSGHVTCLDITKAMLSKGKEKAESEGLRNMDFVLGNAEEMPFLDESYDIVITRLTFHHFVNPEVVFKEMKRVLKKGGKLVIIDMEATQEDLREIEDVIETWRDPAHVKNRSKEELLAYFTNEGMDVSFVDSKEVPVDLSAWMELTKTPKEEEEKIVAAMKDELSGGAKTGFFPYEGENGKIYFPQRWIMMIGRL